MRILHLTPELPSRASSTGGATRQFHLDTRLAEHGHSVVVVAPALEAQQVDVDDLRAKGVEAHIVWRPASRLRELLRAMTRHPIRTLRAATSPVTALQMEIFWQRLRPIVQELLAAGDFDAIAIDHDYCAAWVEDLPDRSVRVLTMHNITAEYELSRATHHGGVRGHLHRFEARRYWRFLRRWLPDYGAIICVSDADAQSVAGRIPAIADACKAIPNGADCGALARIGPPTGGPAVLFTGTMAYPPNADAACWLANEIWPSVVAQVPSAELLIVGRNPTAAVMALQTRPGVTVTGAVPEMAPYFERSTVCVAPIRTGGGTRLKIIEALAAGRATVSTPLGAMGLNVRDGEHIVLRDDAGEFAAAIVELLSDSDLRGRLAGAGREIARTMYDWNALGDRYEQVLSESVPPTKPGGTVVTMANQPAGPAGKPN